MAKASGTFLELELQVVRSHLVWVLGTELQEQPSLWPQDRSLFCLPALHTPGWLARECQGYAPASDPLLPWVIDSCYCIQLQVAS